MPLACLSFKRSKSAVVGSERTIAGRAKRMHEREDQTPTVCPKCGLNNPAANRFCGSCGAVLASTPPDEAILSVIDARVHAVLDRGPKDQKLVEIEIAQAAADRLTGWAKTFGYWAAARRSSLALSAVMAEKSGGSFFSLVTGSFGW
jgi:hypothetical protein